MLSIEDAWLAAFELFAYDGRILTPYRCSTMRIYTWTIRRIGHPNPWQFDPPILEQVKMLRVYPSHKRTCGCWHLTSQTAHLLPRATDAG